MIIKNKTERKQSLFSKTLFNKKILFTASALLMLTIFIVGKSSIFNSMFAGTISGTVFQDFNGNGNFDTAASATVPAVDVGVAGITVTAYDNTGTVRGTGTTNSSGVYSFSATGTAPYRVEFTNLPAGYQPSARSTDSVDGGTTTNSGSTVQFVPTTGATNVNLAINRPDDFCQNNPLVCIPQHYQGNVDGNALRTFPYNYSNDLDGNINSATAGAPSRATNELVPANIGLNNAIGTVYGVAWNRTTRNLYASAFIKRVAKLGSLSGESPGAIYLRSNPSSPGSTPTLYVDLNTVFTGNPAGTNPHPIATTDWTSATADSNTPQFVHKSGLGDLEISQDGSTLYSVNMNDKQLYLIPTSGTLNSTTITRFPIPTTGLTTNGGTCPTVDVRPFALGRDASGQIYVGAVCSGESITGTDAVKRSYLHAFIWRFNAGGTYTLVANRTLNYSRPSAGANDVWLVGDNALRPELVLTDIEFDRGNMIVGLRDRNGDETPTGAADRGYGEILRATSNGSGGWTFESDPSTSATEYYKDLNGDNREEGVQGALLQVPGFNHTMITAYDAVAYNGAGTRISNFYTGGVQRYNNTTGAMSGAYDVYLDAETNTFRKANGMGDIEPLCDSAPIEIGNRVWNDANGNGIQDPGEAGIAGVTVELYNGATPVTYVRYRDDFDNIAYNGSNGSADWSSTPWTEISDDGNVTTGEVRVIYSGNGSYSNGLYLAGDLLTFNGVSRPITLPAAGTMTFNYFRQGEGLSVEYSTNGGTTYTAATTIAAGTDAAVQSGSATIPANATNIRFMTTTLLATSNYVYVDNVQITTNAITTTDANGEYYFSSALGSSTGTNAVFDAGIQPNTAYQVRFSGTPISTLVPTAVDATTNSGNDSNDSDVITSGGLRVINFTTGAAGSNNHTLDAGFSAPVSIGSTVFNDVNNNGIFDAGETGIGGVLVELLYDANNDGVISGTELTTPVASINTSLVAGSIGNYFFNGLQPGNYQVRIPTPPATATLSSTVTTTTDNQVDNDDNGIQTGGAGGSTISPLINLAPGTEPLNAVETGQGGTLDDSSVDSNGDMTIDFGFLAPASVGNFVFIDTNRNGIQDVGEVGLNGVTVTLYNSSGVAIATTTTSTVGANAGQYSFTGLPPGTYSVGFTRPFGYGFSPQNAAGSTAANNSDPDILTGRTATFTLVAGQNNVDIDAGLFQSVAVGNRVWFDSNNNGLYDGGETFFSGATVNLYLDANDDGAPDGAAIRTTTTDTGGLYLFDGLAPNTYIVGVVTPTNYVRSSVNGGDPDNNIDNDNNGSTVSGNETRSLPVTLSLGAEPTGETPNDTTTTADNSGNLTVDFGFTRAYSIGNRVWFDTNNNGQIGAAEVGISGVSVSLFASTDLTTALQTMTTDTSGYYRFDNVVAGSYVVRINPSNFASGGVLAGYQNTAGNTAANLDSTATLGGEDGINPTGAANTILTNGILSNVKTIAINTTAEPTGETDVQATGQGSADNQSNMTIDFGFYKLSVSGTVWSDTGAGANNNNGILNAGEAGISGVVVFLYDSTGAQVPVGPDGILGTADDTVGGMETDSSGNYSFQGLPPGNYRVGINTARTGTPSSVNQTNADNRVDNDNNGTVNAAFPQRIVSNLFSLVAGGEPIVTQATGSSLNTTIDFGFIVAPTLVTLDTFDVLTDGSATTIRWETVSEDANLGFNVYREVNGKRELLNASPIIGTALRSKVNLETKSAGYSWTDVEPIENAVYYLEDIDLKGTRTIHGPVTPLMQDSRLERQSNPKMLSDLRKLAKLAKQTDSVAVNETAAKAAVNPRNGQRQFEIAARDGVKIAVQRDGWYRITLTELQSAGFNLNSDPNNWQLFADGEEIPFRFGAENAVEFYGHGVDLLETDKQTYYLIVGKTAGQRLPEESATEVPQRNDAASFRNTAAIKDRSIYVPGVFNGDESNWFGALVYLGESANYDLAVNNRYSDGQAHLKVKLQGLSDLGHFVNLRFNNLDLGVLNFADFDNQSFEFDLPMSSILEGNNRITLSGAGNDDDLVAVDELSLTYERRFTANDNKLAFRVPAGNTVQVGGFGDKNINVVEVNNDRAARRIAVQSEQTQNGFAFSLNAAGYDREFIAFTGSQTNEPSSIVYNAPSRWNSGKNRAQFVIIAPERFRATAENLASVRRQEGLETQVVSVEDIYDEFSFGATSVSSLKEFLRTAAETWQVAPKYVLLLGDSSYDMRNYLAQPDRNLVPTKLVDTSMLETSADGWIADFNDDGIEDIAIGRLPAGTEAEATRMVGKVTRPRDTVREQKTNLFVADSGFDADADTLRSMLRNNVSSSVIRRSELGVTQMRNEIVTQTDSGQSVITYLGHGSSIAWSSSGFFRKTDAVGLKNDRLSFYLLMTCLNGYTIDPGSDSLSEALLKSENGAYAVWVSSGATRIYGQTDISRAATDLIFNRPNDPLRIGDIARLAKTATADVEIRHTWQLFGDPTMFVR